MRVLVIEDNPANMELAMALLETAGNTILAANTAEKGISLATSEIPDLILMDIHLPDIDGLQVTAILKSNITTKHIPIIAVTAMAMKGDEEKILAAGCDAYLSKPLHYKDLYRTIENLMESKNN
jgi:two-component system cell cycle response regulator DivK